MAVRRDSFQTLTVYTVLTLVFDAGSLTAVTPYFVGLFFPKFLFREFFLPVYGENDEAGRRAEIYWKLMYATQGLVLTALTFASAIEHIDSARALRNSYIAWALFYIAAIIKIRWEADREIIEQNRFGVQVWHAIVVAVLLVDVGINPDVVQAFQSGR